MFPLGSVLVPSMVLPLHVFEPRYRALVHDVLEGGGEFGVCLITRGHEVGGGDVRADVGTVARVHEASELPDGRWALIAIGDRRLRVERWLDDDPYPRAEVVDHPDPAPGPGELERLPDVAAALRTALAKAAEAGDPVPPATLELSDDPVLASHQAVGLAPIATLDRHRLLAAASVGERLAGLEASLQEAIELLDLRLGSDPAGG
jgi:Lon protease-like protein